MASFLYRLSETTASATKTRRTTLPQNERGYRMEKTTPINSARPLAIWLTQEEQPEDHARLKGWTAS